MRNLAVYPVTDCEVLSAIQREIDREEDRLRDPDPVIGDIHGTSLERIQQILTMLDREPGRSSHGSRLEEMLLEIHKKEFGHVAS